MGLIAKFLFLFAVLAFCGIIAATGRFLRLEFISTAVILLIVGRKIGWMFAAYFLYGTRPILAGTLTAIWASAIALTIDLMIQAWHPIWQVKWIFGYLIGLYIAHPSLGLVYPPLRRDRLISIISMIVYVGTLAAQQLHNGHL